MQDLHLVHFENAVPAMADLGLEHLLGPLFQAVFNKKADALKAALTTEGIRDLLQGVASGSKAKALRRLVVALVTPGAELLAAEGDQAKMKALLDQQALRPLPDVWAEFAGFFASLGISLPDTLDSSEDQSGTTDTGDPQTTTGEPSTETAGS